MVAWRVAKCLDQLLKQVNAAVPNRSKASDGSIGDAAHASRVSDHNPWVDDPHSSVNVVTARDFTHDPAGGFNAYAFAESLKSAKDPRVKYVISNRRIWSLARNSEGWRQYDGDNPHTKHTHVSCTSSYPLFDSVAPWRFGEPTEDDVTPEQMTTLVNAANAATAAATKAVLAANAAAAAAKEAGQLAANSSETAGRRWALYTLRYGLQTEDERIAAREEYETRRKAGDSVEQAMAAAAAILHPLDDSLEAAQGKG